MTPYLKQKLYELIDTILVDLECEDPHITITSESQDIVIKKILLLIDNILADDTINNPKIYTSTIDQWFKQFKIKNKIK